jgi:hypothetical protein
MIIPCAIELGETPVQAALRDWNRKLVIRRKLNGYDGSSGLLKS